LLAAFLITGTIDAQVKYTTKKFKPSAVTVELLLNYSQPLPNMYGEINEFFSFSTYGVKSGFGAQINVKLAANKKGTIRPYATLGYSLFLGNDPNTAYIDENRIANGYPLLNNERFGTTPGNSKMYLHIFNAGIGFGYDFVNKTRWTPFLGFEPNLNIIFGTYRQKPVQAVGGNTSDEVSFTIKQTARFGLGISSGIQMRVHKLIGFVFSVKYKYANLFGIASRRIYEENTMELLDKSDPTIHNLLNKSRAIQYLELGLGVAFNIGKR
jgi:hypothetical protein